MQGAGEEGDAAGSSGDNDEDDDEDDEEDDKGNDTGGCTLVTCFQSAGDWAHCLCRPANLCRKNLSCNHTCTTYHAPQSCTKHGPAKHS
jgi:hypothetical protein